MTLLIFGDLSRREDSLWPLNFLSPLCVHRSTYTQKSDNHQPKFDFSSLCCTVNVCRAIRVV